MCAASASAPIPLYNQAKQYWQNLTDECKRYLECVNATLVRNGVDPDDLLQCAVAPDRLEISKARFPSTTVKLTLHFQPWGPVIAAAICSQQKGPNGSLPEEFELPIAIDLDSQVVAIYDEGRSFSPHEVASYLKRYFHCCYPDISLPC